MIKKLDYRPRFVVSKNILDLVKKYCFVNYIAAVLNLLPVALLPIIILNHLGAQQAAYYYIIMMIANLLYVIPQATAKSLFAESSHDEDAIFENLGKSIKIIGMLLLPGIVIFMALGGKILQFFGKNYSSDGTDFMYLAAMAGIPIAIYYIFTSLFRIRKDLSALILTDIVYAGATMGLAYALIPMGLTGVGLAWIAGSSISGIVGYLFMIREKRCGSIRIGYDA
jgi:O-antigen/teichoic acid export membrane protein